MARVGERRVSFLFSGSRVPVSSTLLAGDSNVVRICQSFDADAAVIDCLPVPGARFLNDRKGFHDMLQTRLNDERYDRIYLHLGSNDVLCKEEKFYQRVTTVCDNIHEANPSTEIVICEILPRGPDSRTKVIKPRRNQNLPAQRRWIRTVNNLLWEMGNRVPYVRFLSYDGFSQAHLYKDGLHVNEDGARLCYRTVLKDLEYDPVDLTQPVRDPKIDDDWPALPSKERLPLPSTESSPAFEVEEEPGRTTDSFKSFVDVLEQCVSLQGLPTAGPTVQRGVLNSKKETMKKNFSHMKRHQPLKGRNPRTKSMKKNSSHMKRHQPLKGKNPRTNPQRQHLRDHLLPRPVDSVEVNIFNVHVLVKPHHIQGSLLKPRREEPVQCVYEERTRETINLCPRKKSAPCFFCPLCKISCSREDFLLDHVIRRHTTEHPQRGVGVCRKKGRSSLQEIKFDTSSKPDVPLCQQQEAPFVEQANDQGDKSSRTKRDTSYCEGLYYILPPSQWRAMFRMMVIGILCGGDHDALARLLIILSNDVETEPGPTYECPLKDCARKFQELKDLQFHIVEHHDQWNNISETPTPSTSYRVSQYAYVETTRPELCSQLYSGTILRANSRKRDHNCLNSPKSTYQPWFNNLIENLSSCDNAINLQKRILQTIFEKSLVTPKKQSFIKLEQEAAHVASLKKCSNGTFVCSIFRCTIDDREILYVRYVESGVYTGIMLQNFLSKLKEKFNVSDEDIFLDNVITCEDIHENQEIKKEKAKRSRPDKAFSNSVQNVRKEVSNLKEFEGCPEMKLESFIVHFLPYKSKASIDSPEKMYLETFNNIVSDIKRFLFDFRLNKVESICINSRDLLKEPSGVPKNLLQQSMTLNCLSGDIKRKPHLFKRTARFKSNFLESSFIGTSLRYKTMMLYIKKQFEDLFTFFKSYFPDLDDSIENKNVNEEIEMESTKKRKCVPSVKKVSVTVQDLQNQDPSSVQPVLYTCSNINLYDSFCCSLLEQGKLSIQHFNEDEGMVVCLMNDYNDMDGSFKRNDFVYTIRRKQENGDFFYCSCTMYRTLISLKDSSFIDDESVVLELDSANCLSCLHCKFTKDKVIPVLETGNTSQTRMNMFVRNAMNDIGKPIVDLSVNNESRKYAVYVSSDSRPSFIHLTFNKRLNNFLITCLNGKCLSHRGHKRTIQTMLNSNICQHMTIFKDHPERWQQFVDSESISSVNKTEHVVDENNPFDDSEADTINLHSDCNFDEETGLWKFKCRSLHSPNRKDSSLYRQSLLRRDTWNDSNLKRLPDGSLEGPALVSKIPDQTCDCGAGWTDEGDITIHENSRTLTVYTLIGPVKCKVFTRKCCNITNPCLLAWDEGCSDSLHVLSRDTAAGDEIGWEFVSMVMNSGCTFSAYCNLKTEAYKVRHDQAKFMTPKVFIQWWFSWAANMKTEFRKPCDICGFAPKRLCCDGTKVGVGFRHATFEEISATKSAQPVQTTLHRRMDRCFLKNLTGVEKQELIMHRETLNYLAKKEIGELLDKEVLHPDVLQERINSVKQVLPDEVCFSFDRFLTMDESGEKLKYAYVLKMLSTTASVTSLLPPKFCTNLQQFVSNPNMDGCAFDRMMHDMRSYAPELRDLIEESIINNDTFPEDIRLFLQFLINESLNLESNVADDANPQPGTYNPAKFGRAYYFNEFGLKLRDVRPFSIDLEAKKNKDHDDLALEFERCKKLYSKVQCSAPGSTILFLWFCADHGHCYGFHMTGAEGRKDPAASLYSHLENPPTDIFYDFACNLQEYCLNRESGYYKNVRFFHDVFHSYAHKCSYAFKSRRLQGFESVNSEICEQFNSFIQCIKKSARQMNQSHFCFYLQFFLHEWNERKRLVTQGKTRVALAGLQ